MLPPIKVKICDRNKSMQQAFGDKSAKVETQDGKILIKSGRILSGIMIVDTKP